MPETIKKIHEASLRILERTGIKFLHPRAMEILKAHGVKEKDGVFHFREDQIMDWIKKAPRTFTFRARNPKYDAEIGGTNLVKAPGYGAPLIRDRQGKKRVAELADYIRFCQLYHVNPDFKANGGLIVQPSDVAADVAPIIMHYAALQHTDKCLQAPSGTKEQLEIMMAMSKIVFGDLDQPRMLTIVNTNSPLQVDQVMTDTLLTFGAHGQAAAVSAAVMAGTTGPITLAGAMAVGNAEVLATIALAQMAHPGAPVLYGTQSTTSDMATGSMAGGSPEGALCYTLGAKLAKSYGLPSRGGGAITDAPALSGQSGYEAMLTYLASAGHQNYIIHAAGIIDGFSSMSYEKLIMDFEINRFGDRFLKGVDVTPETLQEDLIHAVGHGGNFMTERHTFRECRKVAFVPRIGTRGAVANPAEQFELNIEKQIEAMLASYERPALSDKAEAEIRALLKDRGIPVPEGLARSAA